MRTAPSSGGTRVAALIAYGLRARTAGCLIWVDPGTIAGGAPHPEHRTDQQPVVDEWRRLWSNTELLPGPWAVFVRRGSRIVLERTPRRRTVAGRR